MVLSSLLSRTCFPCIKCVLFVLVPHKLKCNEPTSCGDRCPCPSMSHAILRFFAGIACGLFLCSLCCLSLARLLVCLFRGHAVKRVSLPSSCGHSGTIRRERSDSSAREISPKARPLPADNRTKIKRHITSTALKNTKIHKYCNPRGKHPPIPGHNTIPLPQFFFHSRRLPKLSGATARPKLGPIAAVKLVRTKNVEHAYRASYR